MEDFLLVFTILSVVIPLDDLLWDKLDDKEEVRDLHLELDCFRLMWLDCLLPMLDYDYFVLIKMEKWKWNEI